MNRVYRFLGLIDLPATCRHLWSIWIVVFFSSLSALWCEPLSAVRWPVCEDLCNECGEVQRCGYEWPYLCQYNGVTDNGRECVDPTPWACGCCEADEILVGTPSDGYCQKCPSGQIRTKDSNECCTPDSLRTTCGNQCTGPAVNNCGWRVNCTSSVCQSGQTCYNGRCCTLLTREQACGSRQCGTVSNGCGGTINCGSCAGEYQCKSDGACRCPATQPKDCGDGICTANYCP